MATATKLRARAEAREAAAESTSPLKIGAERIAISAPNIKAADFTIVGTSPYMQARFSAKAMQAMHDKHVAGSVAQKGKAKQPRDFDADYLGAMHFAEEGWNGIPAAAFRCACIDACRLVGFKMTLAKLSLFFQADGLDRVDGMPLIRIIGDEPERTEMATRNATGVVDLRVRPMWRKWSADLTVEYDGDQFTHQDVANLLQRAGQQVGIGEGRPFSRNSAGLGYGRFEILAAKG